MNPFYLAEIKPCEIFKWWTEVTINGLIFYTLSRQKVNMSTKFCYRKGEGKNAIWMTKSEICP